MEESGDEDDVPEGAVRFELDASDIEAALAEDGLEVEAREDVDVRIFYFQCFCFMVSGQGVCRWTSTREVHGRVWPRTGWRWRCARTWT